MSTSSVNTWPRGSEWRRWDLQVHTPFSELNNGFGSDLDVYAHRLFRAAHDLGIAAIGVTDYFGIEGYKWLTSLRTDASRLETLLGRELAEWAQTVLLLPNVELRSREIVRSQA